MARRPRPEESPVRTVPFVGALAAFGAAVAVVLAAGPGAVAQEAAKGPPPKPQEAFQQVRNYIGDGKYDIAALFLQAFLDSNPTEQDLLDIEGRYGTTVFRQLRTIPKWSDDPKVDAQARATVEAIIKRAGEATDKLLRNPARVNKFIRNLGQTAEERLYAQGELRRTGDYAVPFMVESLRAKVDPAVTAAILETIPKLEGPAMAAWVAALDGLDADLQYRVLAALASRPDVLALLTAAQSDFVPYLWRLAGRDETLPALRKFAADTLQQLVRGADKRQPEAELVAAARPFADRKARYADSAANPNGQPTLVTVWTWNAADSKLVKQEGVPVGQADEYFGLRYARWALEQRPDYEPAQVLILTLATERAMERGKFGDLAKTDAAVYRMLAAAPATVLTDLLEQSLREKRTGLVLALTQVVGDRAERGPAATGKPPLLERALDYPDPRVQLAAANALLRAPVPVDPKLRGRVVDVLRRAAAADPGVPGGAAGQAAVVDPNRRRADATAAMLRSLGYDSEIFGTGRDLLRRVSRAADLDLILIDQHVPNPGLFDLVAHLRADANAARRPILVVASADRPIPPSFDQLLLRLAVLIAATETETAGIPDPFSPNPKQSPEDWEKERATVRARRDGVFRSTAETRVARTRRVLETTGLELTDDQKFQVKLRVEQVTYAVLAAEYPLTPEASPATFEHVTTLQKQINTQPAVPAVVRRVGVDHLVKLLERFELDVANAKPADARYDAIRARVDVDALGLVVQPPRDPVIEEKVSRQMRGFPAVRVIPEPYSRTWFAADVNAAFADPADRPRDPAEKKAAARLAVGWLAKMATGEVPGFDVKPAAAELVATLRTDDLAEAGIDAVARAATADAQQALVSLALTGGRPLPLRVKAADAAIRHVQAFGKLTPDTLVGPVAAQAAAETDADLRGKFLVLKGLLAPNPQEYVTGLRNYSPPLVPAAPPMPKEPPVPPEPKPKD